MIAQKQHHPKKKDKDGSLIIRQSAAKYAGQLAEVSAAAYQIPLESTYSPDYFRKHLEIFPEGQFIALDTSTDQVVAYSINMRYAYDPAHPLLEPWGRATDYG
jgi:hypothetical protein